MVMTYLHAKAQGQQSVGSEDRVETNSQTDGRTDGGDCITCRINVVSNCHHNPIIVVYEMYKMQRIIGLKSVEIYEFLLHRLHLIPSVEYDRSSRIISDTLLEEITRLFPCTIMQSHRR